MAFSDIIPFEEWRDVELAKQELDQKFAVASIVAMMMPELLTTRITPWERDAHRS